MSSGTTDILQSKYMLMEFAELEDNDVRNKKKPSLILTIPV